jgi:ATP-dependent exoDNAse (exonuclease V) beta subunit
MIDKNTNILRDPKIKRIVEYKEGDKQVNVLDSRFYRRDEKYYPSVTSILNYFPKNQFFHSWLKDVGHNSDIIANKAANEGTQVHNAVEAFLNGEEIQWLDENGSAKYSMDVWKMILKFADFWNTHKPELVVAEYHLFSDEHEYAGTADLIVRWMGNLWLLDVKTSNSLHTSYDLQLAAYATAWNETHNEKITHTGILWLKANTRGEGKGDKIQGKGWEVKFISDIENNFKMFKNIQEIYKLENPNFKPATETLPTSVKIVK